jgi:hypothetical protein
MRGGAVVLAIALMAAGVAPAEDMPSEIVGFYDDWNFVVLNSTGSERNTLWMIETEGQTENLSVSGQEVVERMTRIHEMLERHAAIMPTSFERPPVVSSELTIPTKVTQDGRSAFTVVVSRVTIPLRLVKSVDDSDWPWELSDLDGHGLTAAGQFIDQWVESNGKWKVLRSIFVPSGA